MRNRLWTAGIAAIALVALGGAGIYVYFFSGLRSSPTALGLSSPSPAASPSSTPSSTSSSGLAGQWTVAAGSLAGYRVKELFVGESAKHEAVARTSTVGGGLTVSGDGTSGYQVSAITITVGLGDLHSVDSVAGRNVTQRDGIVQRQLDVSQFPDATFMASSASIPGPVTGQQVTIKVPGKLTIHGVTKDVTVTGKAQVNGDKIEIAGSLAASMSDFGVSPPAAPFVTVDPTITIEFDVFLSKAA
jgi:polyisoprenoid-binding protein YceI